MNLYLNMYGNGGYEGIPVLVYYRNMAPYNGMVQLTKVAPTKYCLKIWGIITDDYSFLGTNYKIVKE